MELRRQEVQRAALLARLRLTPEEEVQVTDQLAKILRYMDKLGGLDTSGVQPFTHASDSVSAMRDDKISNTPAPDTLLANAPARDQTFFQVPKIIE